MHPQNRSFPWQFSLSKARTPLLLSNHTSAWLFSLWGSVRLNILTNKERICMSGRLQPLSHRSPAQLRLAGPSGSLCSSLCPSRDTQSRVPRATSRWLWEILKEETPQPLGSLWQCSITAQHRRVPGVQRELPAWGSDFGLHWRLERCSWDGGGPEPSLLPWGVCSSLASSEGCR